jgi:nitrite reductase/ring-hydroxylating ferredoxin subunit
MDTKTSSFVRAGNLEELKAKGRIVVHGRHRPILLVHEDGQVFALDNRCPHMGFPLDRGSIEDDILTCHWHHARFALASGCTFDLWAEDVPTCPVEIRAGDLLAACPIPSRRWRERDSNPRPRKMGSRFETAFVASVTHFGRGFEPPLPQL